MSTFGGHKLCLHVSICHTCMRAFTQNRGRSRKGSHSDSPNSRPDRRIAASIRNCMRTCFRTDTSSAASMTFREMRTRGARRCGRPCCLTPKARPYRRTYRSKECQSKNKEQATGRNLTVPPSILQSSSLSPLSASMRCPFGLELASKMPEQPPLALLPPRHERCPTVHSHEQPWGDTQRKRNCKTILLQP